MAPQALLLALVVALGSALLPSPPRVAASPVVISSWQEAAPPPTPGVPPPVPVWAPPLNPVPVQDGIAADCNLWYAVLPGEGCSTIVRNNGIALDELEKWNPGIGVSYPLRPLLFRARSGEVMDRQVGKAKQLISFLRPSRSLTAVISLSTTSSASTRYPEPRRQHLHRRKQARRPQPQRRRASWRTARSFTSSCASTAAVASNRQRGSATPIL